ncbi:uncharacterized protein ACHE_20954S [Aspergillus chevalieri]|uniref:Uncharacterized protein n=1 Tax=Aspergillus chevalieri TaxID=182096 RepID=A0A7R7VIV6_ASPCH|nr:uncharacterized protein ACHE_20954S [Aspergillus chevalieri]BCR85496.1 hypothetical protein ACHE_20954S [Aspergillus chevalieri]
MPTTVITLHDGHQRTKAGDSYKYKYTALHYLVTAVANAIARIRHERLDTSTSTSTSTRYGHVEPFYYKVVQRTSICRMPSIRPSHLVPVHAEIENDNEHVGGVGGEGMLLGMY